MKSLIRNSFGRAAWSYYDSAEVQKEVAGICASNCPDGHYENVLDIGSGVGFLAGNFTKRISCSNYFSLDMTLPMLLEQRVHFHNPMLLAADGEALPFRQNCFDLVISSSAMQWYMAPERSIFETFECLKPGGIFSFSIFVEGTLKELADVSLKTGFGRMYDLKSEKSYLDIFKNVGGIEFAFDLRDFVSLHSSVREFLKKHKMTGAGASGKKMNVSKRHYQEFVREYERLYSLDGKVKSTFRSLFVYGRKIKM